MMTDGEVQHPFRSPYQWPVVGCIGVDLRIVMIIDRYTINATSRPLKDTIVSNSGPEVDWLLIYVVYILFNALSRHVRMIVLDKWMASKPEIIDMSRLLRQ
jgi:hypothetical protein